MKVMGYWETDDANIFIHHDLSRTKKMLTQDVRKGPHIKKLPKK